MSSDKAPMTSDRIKEIQDSTGYPESQSVQQALLQVWNEVAQYYRAIHAAISPEELAKLFHDEYERLAPLYGYKTREESAVPWDEVPESNRFLMIATCKSVIEKVGKIKEHDEDNGTICTWDSMTFQKIACDISERLRMQPDSRCATDDEVAIAWLVSEIEDIKQNYIRLSSITPCPKCGNSGWLVRHNVGGGIGIGRKPCDCLGNPNSLTNVIRQVEGR